MNLSVKLAAVAVLVVAGTAAASSVDVRFSRVTANSSQNVASQFLARVSQVSGQPNLVRVRLTNAVGIYSSISEVYYDSRGTSPLNTTIQPTLAQFGASFTGGGASPGNLPGGANLSTAFNAVTLFSADAQGNPSVGIDAASDWLDMTFTLLSGRTFANVVSALNNGDLRIGLHVRAIGNDKKSDSFVSTPPVVPLPPAAWAGLATLAGVAAWRRVRRG